MTGHYIILPVLAHMLTAIILLFGWRYVIVQRLVSIAGNVLVLAMDVLLMQYVWENGIQTMQAGDWPAPFGITFVADVFSCTMILLTGIAGLAVSIFSSVGIGKARQRFGYFPIFHFLLMGLNGAFLTGDIFNLYVWFEIVLIASFVLMILGGKKPQIEGGIQYVTMNLLASMIFLTAIGILYGLTGSLNMADLSHKVTQVQNRGLVNVTAFLFMAGFGIKAAVFPLYFWLPASYHTPPSAISAILSGLITKAGVYALLRLFTLIFVPDRFIQTTFMIIAAATLLIGALGALAKTDLRQIFSYLIVCHIGFMITGLGLFTRTALTGAIFYLVHDVMVKTNLFLIAGLIARARGTTDIKKPGGLYSNYPRLSLLMAVVLFSLAGIPPLSGFWPKILLFRAVFTAQSWLLLVSILFAGFATLYVIGKIWVAVFWRPAPAGGTEYADQFKETSTPAKMLLVTPVLLLAMVTLYIGLGADNIMAVSDHIASELINPNDYIRAVLKTPLSP